MLCLTFYCHFVPGYNSLKLDAGKARLLLPDQHPYRSPTKMWSLWSLRSLPLLFLILATSTEGQMIYNITPSVETGNADYGGYPCCFWARVLHLECQSFFFNITRDDLYDIKVQLHLPRDVHSTTDCDEMIDGTLTQCSTTSNNYSPIYVNMTTAKLRFWCGIECHPGTSSHTDRWLHPRLCCIWCLQHILQHIRF